jgi:hypothetical protein
VLENEHLASVLEVTSQCTIVSGAEPPGRESTAPPCPPLYAALPGSGRGAEAADPLLAWSGNCASLLPTTW